METLDTVKANHHTRWDISDYQKGWNHIDNVIAKDFPALDYPTARLYAGSSLEIAQYFQAHDDTNRFYFELGAAARWLAAVS